MLNVEGSSVAESHDLSSFLFFQRLILFPDVISVAMEFHSAPLGSCSCSYLHMHLNDLMKCIQTFIEMISALLIAFSLLSKI